MRVSKFNLIFGDEAQDTNAIQRAILRKMIGKTTRVIAVGDPAQAIYGFRGADSNSMNRIAKEFNCVTLPLTVSYRCPQSVVLHAQQWVNHIECAPDAPMGEVQRLQTSWSPDQFKAGDMIVCRTTAPLIALGYKLLTQRKPFYIMGREIGSNLKALVTKQKAKGIDALQEKLAAWNSREVEKAIAKDDESKAQAISDKYQALCHLIDSLNENNRTIPALIKIIDDLFAEKQNATILCTIHKAKGLESENVYWLNSSQCPSKWARGWQKQQEINLCYVATTRAKSKLILIEEPKKE